MESLAQATRAKSTMYSTFGVGITGLIAALPILFASTEFKDLLFMWLSNNPTLAAFILLAANVVITEILKSMHNSAAIAKQEEEGGIAGSRFADRDGSIILI